MTQPIALTFADLWRWQASLCSLLSLCGERSRSAAEASGASLGLLERDVRSVSGSSHPADEHVVEETFDVSCRSWLSRAVGNSNVNAKEQMLIGWPVVRDHVGHEHLGVGIPLEGKPITITVPLN